MPYHFLKSVFTVVVTKQTNLKKEFLGNVKYSNPSAKSHGLDSILSWKQMRTSSRSIALLVTAELPKVESSYV